MSLDILTLPSHPAARASVPDGTEATVTSVTSVGQLFEALRTRAWDATLVSLDATNVDESVLERTARQGAAGALLLSTGRASLAAALLAERLGAVAVLSEPFASSELTAVLESLASEGREHPLPEAPGTGDSGDGDATAPMELIGRSRVMMDVFAMIARVAGSGSTVLLTGESGTGKEVVARILHRESARAAGPFVAINCAAIPEHLLESELFGHERGAFTGAVAKREGRFQRADGGTLFLDEIGDMSPALQAKVLRALEDRVVERIGGGDPVPVDVRVIAATNRALGQAIADGSFREDLYHRLAVVEIDLPPLRERGTDVRELALHFASHFARRHTRPIRAITEAALRRLEGETWPGNVRELRNVLDRAVLLTTGDVIRAAALRLGSSTPTMAAKSTTTEPAGYPTGASLAEVEADHIRRVLEAEGGHIARSADVLGIHRNTLTRKVQEYGLAGSGEGTAR